MPKLMVIFSLKVLVTIRAIGRMVQQTGSAGSCHSVARDTLQCVTEECSEREVLGW